MSRAQEAGRAARPEAPAERRGGRLLVTGATGMLGSYVVEVALEDGWEVRALVRDPCSATWLAALGVDLAVGDLRSGAAVHRAARGCDVIVHAAATIGAGQGGHFKEGNILGTGNVVEAARRSAARLVHVSSTAVVGTERYRYDPVDESLPLPPLPRWDGYGRSKQGAEKVVLEAAGSGRAWACVVRPPVMYGRRDRQFVPRVAPLLERGLAPIAAGRPTTLPLVHGASVARGILAAATSPHAGGRVYHLTEDRPVTVEMLWRAGAEGLGRPVRIVRVPPIVLGMGFAALAGILAGSGRRGLARHAMGTWRMLTRDNPFSAERAREELGWRPAMDPAAALADAFRWWRTHRGEARP